MTGEAFAKAVTEMVQTLYRVACRLPEDLPDRLFIRWMDSQTYVDEATLIERTDR